MRSLCKIKSNIVTTKPLDDWKSLYQRVRWASDDFLSECFRTGAGISCFIGNLSIVVGYGYGFIIATDYLFVNST
jgi:hypothetical protein